MDISGFDPSTMTYLATQMQHPSVAGGQDAFQEMLLPAEFNDQQSTYGGYAGSEDLNLHALQAPPQLRRYPSNYEDPFSDVVSAFDNSVHHDPHDPETPSIDRDNKLLSFTVPSLDYTLLDYTYRRATIALAAQLHGMFFLAESPWASAGDANAAPSELTCYRRNLFQISGEVVLTRTLRYIMTDTGENIPIIGQELVMSATESTEGNPVKIISVPWKTPAGASATMSEDKIEREPPSMPLDLMNVPEMGTDFATFPFQWKRLQFRIATANNGRRKELQQHFVIRLKVLATLATGGKVSLCEVQSGAIIVRGRSPRNFQQRKDTPLNGGGHARKSSNVPGRAATVASDKVRQDRPTYTPIKAEVPPPPQSVTAFFEPQDQGAAEGVFNWEQARAGAQGQSLGQARIDPPQPNEIAFASPDLPRSVRQPPAPINLSLVEDDSPQPSATPSDGKPAKRLQLPPRPPSFSLNTINSPDESADLLYEYFPLGLDDWMPPVDAVYRPHVVHHTKLPTDPRDPKQTAKSRSKRYFSEDVS